MIFPFVALMLLLHNSFGPLMLLQSRAISFMSVFEVVLVAAYSQIPLCF